MLDAPLDSVLAILADFGPSLLAVAPFLPALLLAVALLAITTRPEPVALPFRRQLPGLRRPELALAGLVVAAVLSAAVIARGLHA